VDELSKKLPNLIGTYDVQLKTFNHLDFLWAIDADDLVYNLVIEQMKKL
jgi:hypothetical protein